MKKYLFILLVMLIACKHKKEKPIADDFGLKDLGKDTAAQRMQVDSLTKESQQGIAPWKRKPKTQPPIYVPPAVQNTPAIVYLEFNGTTVSGTNWNTAGSIICQPSGLTADQIIAVFDSIAYKLRTFNIITTTDKTLYTGGPRQQMVVFTTSYEWYGLTGGVSLKNSFGTGAPCFIFTKALNFNLKYIFEAGIHEPGHTFGLSHHNQRDANCNYLSEYDYKSIMGVGYYIQNSQWVYDPCTGQNDSVIIKTKVQ